jgi:hypothetical protein
VRFIAWVVQLIGDVGQYSQGDVIVMRSCVEEHFILLLLQAFGYFGGDALD